MAESHPQLAQAERLLRVRFQQPELLRMALTHSSVVHEGSYEADSERLEFLGDAVLGLLITERIYARFPHMPEGDLAKLRSNLVRAETLAAIAARLGLGELILMSKGTDQAGGRHNESILSDSLEAVIGAVYLDGGMGPTSDLVNRLFTNEIIDEVAGQRLADAKTTLQELTMAKWSVLPEYKMEHQSGPAHKPMFKAIVSVKGKILGEGVGTSKKRAQQIAASEALAALEK